MYAETPILCGLILLIRLAIDYPKRIRESMHLCFLLVYLDGNHHNHNGSKPPRGVALIKIRAGKGSRASISHNAPEIKESKPRRYTSVNGLASAKILGSGLGSAMHIIALRH